VRPAVLVRGGSTIFWVPARGPADAVATLGDTPEGAARLVLAGFPEGLPSGVRRRLATLPAREPVASDDPGLVAGLSEAGFPAAPLSIIDRRAARESIPPPDLVTLRAFVLAKAQTALSARLSEPEEVLIDLAREEMRLERALRREQSAAESFQSRLGAAQRRYTESGHRFRAGFAEHHGLLRRELETAAVEVAPNLTALLGATLAARLVSAADGLRPLGRMSGARIQLLGARRRPSPTRGPRYCHLFRAPRMEDVPLDRRAAYARSLAALAAIAARADLFTRRSISPELIARRDRRIQQLRRRR
jgi:hypothetical protein